MTWHLGDPVKSPLGNKSLFPPTTSHHNQDQPPASAITIFFMFPQTDPPISEVAPPVVKDPSYPNAWAFVCGACGAGFVSEAEWAQHDVSLLVLKVV